MWKQILINFSIVFLKKVADRQQTNRLTTENKLSLYYELVQNQRIWEWIIETMASWNIVDFRVEFIPKSNKPLFVAMAFALFFEQSVALKINSCFENTELAVFYRI